MKLLDGRDPDEMRVVLRSTASLPSILLAWGTGSSDNHHDATDTERDSDAS